MTNNLLKYSLIHLFPTLKCNLYCQYCYSNSNYIGSDENPSLLKRICQEVNKLEIGTIHIEGGETFFNNNIFIILENLKTTDNVSVFIVTNATMITDDIALKVKSYGIKNIIVSMDGDEKTHNLLRKNSYQKVLNGIKILKKYNFIIDISTTLNKLNLNQMDFIVTKSIEMGINKVRFGDVINTGRNENNIEDILLDGNDYKKIISKYKELNSNQVSILLNLSLQRGILFKNVSVIDIKQSEDSIISADCSMGKDQLAILPNGDVYPCYNVVTKNECKIGNIFEHSGGIIEMINNSNYLQKLKNAQHINCPVNTGGHCYIGSHRMVDGFNKL